MNKNSEPFSKLTKGKVAALASLAATGVASLSGTIVNGMGGSSDHDPWARSEQSVSSTTGNTTSSTKIDASVGPNDVLPGVPLPGARVTLTETTTEKSPPPTASVEQTKRSLSVQEMEYARQFAQSPEADQMKDYGKGVEQTVQIVADLLNQGYSANDIAVLVKGKASDENISTTRDPNGGFGTKEPKNFELAQKRGETVHKKIVEELLQQTGIDFANTIKTVTPEEIQDPVLEQQIKAIAESRGMSLRDFINIYNNGGEKDRQALDLDKAERETMRQHVSNRGADIVILAKKKVVVGETPDSSEEQGEVGIVFIPIIIPPFPSMKISPTGPIGTGVGSGDGRDDPSGHGYPKSLEVTKTRADRNSYRLGMRKNPEAKRAVTKTGGATYTGGKGGSKGDRSGGAYSRRGRHTVYPGHR
jgi:hypothetical protein